MSSVLETYSQTLSLNPARPVHFIGLGGIGMSGLAKILIESGFQVSGSDVRENANLKALAAQGATVHVGHRAENLPTGADVIVSTAIATDNPEIQQAMETGCGIFHRSQLLREILQGEAFTQHGQHQYTVGITGTHGKTTITGMTGLALQAAGLNPTIVAGGLLPGLDTNAILGKSSHIAVAELDESDGTLLQYTPTHSVVANLELDHADHYTGGLNDVVKTFQKYLRALHPDSKVVFNTSCPTTTSLIDVAPSHIEPILIAPGDVYPADEQRTTYWLKNVRMWHRGCYQGYVYKKKRMLGELNLTVPGRHNLFNALAAIALGDQLGAEFEPMAEALHKFSGMGRRFERVGSLGGAWLVDDYAHHPTEVLATLKAAKEALPGGTGQVIAVFQPHRFSRLKTFWDDFQTCFGDAHQVVITDVYAASEEPIDGVSAEALVQAMKQSGRHPNVRYLPKAEWEAFRQELDGEAKPQDIILSLGAGDVTNLFRNWKPQE
jgi:UDP-N-acetylmuramate--alanine ligase